jgi:hypothetical protein
MQVRRQYLPLQYPQLRLETTKDLVVQRMGYCNVCKGIFSCQNMQYLVTQRERECVCTRAYTYVHYSIPPCTTVQDELLSQMCEEFGGCGHVVITIIFQKFFSSSINIEHKFQLNNSNGFYLITVTNSLIYLVQQNLASGVHRN